MQTCTLAVDIGASSGRHIAGTVQNGKITLQEVYRFENGVHRENGHLCWDIDTLAKEVVNGLKAAHDAGFAPATIGIDTWGVDFGLLDRRGNLMQNPVHYRDPHTVGVPEQVFKIIPKEEIYEKNRDSAHALQHPVPIILSGAGGACSAGPKPIDFF